MSESESWDFDISGGEQFGRGLQVHQSICCSSQEKSQFVSFSEKSSMDPSNIFDVWKCQILYDEHAIANFKEHRIDEMRQIVETLEVGGDYNDGQDRLIKKKIVEMKNILRKKQRKMNRLQNVINFLAILFLAIWTNCLNAIFLLGPEGISLLFVGIYSIVLIIIALGIGFALHKKKMVNLSGKEID